MEQEVNSRPHIKTYSRTGNSGYKSNTSKNTIHSYNNSNDDTSSVKSIPVTTKNAVEFLVNGTLKKNVCRFCLNIASPLSELDQIFEVAGQGAFYKVTIREMIAVVHPFKMATDPNFPNKICNKCINRTISSYLFSQQCEQAERALRNCFEDVFDKLNKLDPINKIKKRGRQKANPNHNIIYTEHKNVIDYADPIITLVNTTSVPIGNEPIIQELECLKCAQVLLNTQSLLNHETLHPKSMWYNCRLCGTSFVKRNQLKKHFRTRHSTTKAIVLPSDTSIYECAECGHQSDNYGKHLQHITSHKFLNVLDRLVHKDMDRLCNICLNEGTKMVDLDEMVCLHGGYSELSGDRNLYTILGATLPKMNVLHNYTGTKICDRCYNNAITSYIFINQSYCIRERLENCIDLMLSCLNNIAPENNMFIEISRDLILDVKEDYDKQLLIDENEVIDESNLKVDVLEDEFRLKSDEESDIEQIADENDDIVKDLVENPARNATKTYMTKRKMVNGLQHNNTIEISEFLTFNKKKEPVKCKKIKYTCPVCNKHFISVYFLRKHIVKHLNKEVKCNLCNNNYKSKFHLHEHKKTEHLTNDTIFLPCTICGRAFDKQIKLKKHIKTHKRKQCELCNKVFKTQKCFDTHMQRHFSRFNLQKSNRVQNCSFCEKDCGNDNELSLHVNKIHLQIKPYGCDMCDKQYYTEMNLKSHRLVHSLPSKEICHFCNKVLKCRRNLVIHVRKHLNEKPYNCQICNSLFCSEGSLGKHMNIIHGGRYVCRLCKSVFSSRNSLKTHVNVAHSLM